MSAAPAKHGWPLQIKEEFKRFARHVDVRAEAFFGGKPISEDKKLLRSKEQAPHVIIGTPGRIKGVSVPAHTQLC